jgi:hypothetical protein
MKKILLVVVLFQGLLSFSSVSADEVKAATSPNTRMTYPGVFGLEVLGRGLLGSVFFDYSMSESVAVGLGLGQVSTVSATTSSASVGATAWMLPVYMNYYFMKSAGSVFASAGLSLVTNSNQVAGTVSNPGQVLFSNNMIIPELGVGYEYRTDTQFVFRVQGYGLWSVKLSPWIGLSFGYGF